MKTTHAPNELAHERTQPDLPGWSMDKLDYPTFRITLIAKIMDRLTLRRLAESGDTTYAEWRVLARLAGSSEGLSVGQIAEQAWVDRAEVSRAITTLEQRGLVERRENIDDRRKPLMTLSPAGAALYRDIIKERRGFHEALLSGLSDRDRSELDRLLAQIGQRLMEMHREP